MAARGLLTLAVLAGSFSLLSVSSRAASPEAAAAQSIPDAYRRIAAEARVPAESLYSLAMAESTRKTAWGSRPWPWTLNVAGKGYHYETREAAYNALLGFMQRWPLKRIDVGVAQVNLGWNGHFFATYREAFDPYTNLRAAARILRACYDARPGSWIRAAGCYHHPAGGRAADTYIAIVRRKLGQIAPAAILPVNDQPLRLASTSLSWIEPQ